MVAFVGQVYGADVDAGVQSKGVLGKFADELAREVDGEVIGVEVAVIFCEFVEDAGFFGLGDAFFYGVAICAGRQVVFFVAFPKFGEFDVGIYPVRAVGVIFYEGAQGVEIGFVVAVFVGSFVMIGADEVVTRVGFCFGGGVFFCDVFKNLSRFFRVSDGELIFAFFHFKAGDPFGCGFVGFFEFSRGFVGFANAPQAVVAQDFAGGHGFVARGFGYALVRGDGLGVFFRLEEEVAYGLVCVCAEGAVGIFF